jgi:SAM-dependent methyltransferase
MTRSTVQNGSVPLLQFVPPFAEQCGGILAITVIGGPFRTPFDTELHEHLLRLFGAISAGELHDQGVEIRLLERTAQRGPPRDQMARVVFEDFGPATLGNWRKPGNLGGNHSRQKEQPVAHERLPAQLRRPRQMQIQPQMFPGRRHTAYHRKQPRKTTAGENVPLDENLSVPMHDNLTDYHWLVSDAARQWLAEASEQLTAAAGQVSAALVSRLRKSLPALRAQLVLEQAALRLRARDKFTSAEQMFFTRQALEQATDERVAVEKAARFPGEAAVADLCCGIGGDLIALAERSQATGIDLSPSLAILAEANLATYGRYGSRALAERAESVDLAGYAAWHIDPDRRPRAVRTTKIDLGEPPLETLDQMLAINPAAAIKLAPAAEVQPSWAARSEQQWLGSRGECRQLVAWFGALAHRPGRHSATVVDARGGPRTIVGSPATTFPVASRIGRFLYEPHAAVLAARLVATLCADHAWEAVSAQTAYLTSDQRAQEPACASFEVQEVLPLDRKQLRAYFRERQIGRLEVKKRGVEVDPERLRKEVSAEGDESATLLICPIGGRVQAIVARRLEIGEFSPTL